jgi:extradiol dioxygenase
MKIRGLGYVGVQSPNQETWSDIGPDVFALQLADPGPDGAIRLKMDSFDYRIAVHQGESDELLYLGWELSSEGDIAAASETLDKVGIQWSVATAEECSDRGVLQMVKFIDPGGLPHELFIGLRENQRTFYPPRPFNGFVTGDQGLGHAGVYVADLEIEHEFLTGVLGFRLTDVVDTPMWGRIYFYHCNPRHHSLVTLPTDGKPGLQHLMLQVSDIDDLGISLDKVYRRPDLPVIISLGRHSTDRMLSYYVRTPSGFNVEYGWGALRLTDDWMPTQNGFPAELWGHKYDPGDLVEA